MLSWNLGIKFHKTKTHFFSLNGVWKKLMFYATRAESVPERDEIGNAIKDVCLARQINLEVGSDNDQELLDSHNQELTIDELIKMHEQEEDIENLDSLTQFN